MTDQTLAILFFLAAGVAALAWIVRAFRRSPYTPFQTMLFWTDVLLCRLLWRVEICGPFPFAKGEGAVLVCNHRSPVDPFFIQLVTGRPVHWMVAKEFCDHWSTGWFLRATEAIPTRRGGVDTTSTKSAIRLASEGELIGMFPEGRINQTNDLLLPVRPGAALVAIKARVPALPCYIEGSPYGISVWSPFFMPARVRLHFGEPIDLSEFFGREREPGVLAEVMRRLTKEIGCLAGDEQFEVKFAGRRWVDGAEVGD